MNNSNFKSAGEFFEAATALNEAARKKNFFLWCDLCFSGETDAIPESHAGSYHADIWAVKKDEDGEFEIIQSWRSYDYEGYGDEESTPWLHISPRTWYEAVDSMMAAIKTFIEEYK